ncbi:putative 2OG-Fe(II) oxygenase family oxidoreductase [Aspergillus clavatus NRRL 1]|uniref:2OG-Fe(II) oxygenase family oxidoreductase, putative n=1 Tax=Aspergillus clavatus (strain ATCC 1007 / CBS 513.65 / DSM 816 / NCTC 3887 / NRRL 1 / QM 1276 / 107) TaxID=344612 RepID=A1CN06_ASPCL|nr:2OG-Fe(II) oxygenase family oxidoreductase, putative [Aspergillus clavatus NRRL 1]EAW08943.1 2OG-Fe(II) oxygenase family oxidoreductase, putative [Aspergillus clavatus NRRL 1]
MTRSLGTTTAAGSSKQDLGATMPPNYKARVGDLETFELPAVVTGSLADVDLGKALIAAWRRDGILQVAMEDSQKGLLGETFDASKNFFRKPHREKAACVDSQSYSGYIASAEEITDGIPDYSEIFTVTKDLELSEPRVKSHWPCHGPCPWPDDEMKTPMQRYMDYLGQSGEKLLQLVEYGLGVPSGALTNYTQDGWHHMRILRFPAVNAANGKGKDGRGIGSHTDYGLLVIAAQDDVGGLFIRPPAVDETTANWEQSAAGLWEDDDGWTYVAPVPNVFTVFPGDMMQYLTNSYLPSTPHKVGLNTRERFAFAYFHEPSFQSVITPLEGYDGGQNPREGIHYGTHFTNMFMRNYPDRITSQRIIRENRKALLADRALRAENVLSAST